MSSNPPDVPGNPPPVQPPRGTSGPPPQPPKGPAGPPRRGDGNLVALGLLVGIVVLSLFYVAAFSMGGPSPRGLTGPAAFIPVAVYLLVSILLAVRPGTRPLGAGLLFGLGVWTLVGGGACIGALAQFQG
jgi:hypothetical protein